MAENENMATVDEPVVTEEPPVIQPPEESKPSLGKRFLGSIKERCRKFIVKLKRRPMNIAFFVLIVSTVLNLCNLGNLSQLGLVREFSINYEGLCIFVGQLLSILVLLLFMNSFPKRSKKPKIVMLVLFGVFIAGQLAIDIFLYVDWTKIYVQYVADFEATDVANLNVYYVDAVRCVLAHLILVGLAAVLTATYPLYGKLLGKINTRKNIEGTELKEEIDTDAEV